MGLNCCKRKKNNCVQDFGVASLQVEKWETEEEKEHANHLRTKNDLQQAMTQDKFRQNNHNSSLEITFWDLTHSNENIHDVYTFGDLIGAGHFSKVRKGFLKQDESNRIYAIKSIRKDLVKSNSHLLKRELEILRTVDYPAIAEFYESYGNDKCTHFVVEYCEGGTLSKFIKKNNRLDEDIAIGIFFEILLAVNYLHNQGICHRDIKAGNFLLSKCKTGTKVKMIDFGLSKRFDRERLETKVGTPLYVAREVILGNYDQTSDYWSLGVLLYYMLAGSFPFQAPNEAQLLEEIIKSEFNLNTPFWMTKSKECKELIQGFLEIDTKKRLTAERALQHPWFSNINLEITRKGKQYMKKDYLDRMRNFHRCSKFKRRVLILMTHIYGYIEEAENLRFIFMYLDYLNNGAITSNELQAFFSEFNEELEYQEAMDIINSLSVKGKEVITFKEFLTGCINPEYYRNPQHLKLAFRRFDIEGTGTISKENIKSCFRRFGYLLIDNTVERMIEDIDFQKVGEITEEEFNIHMLSD